jgi:hypothetical protein
MASSIIDVEGSTLGCFGTSCSTPTDFGSPAGNGTGVSPTYGLVFTGTSFDVVTDSSGSVSNFSLGTIGRGNVNVSDSLPALPFTLQVTFTLPAGILGGQSDTFTALIKGTNNGGGGAVAVDFDNTWQFFSFSNALGTGSFYFSVLNDLSVSKNTLNTPSAILAGIRSPTFTAAPPPDNTTAAPEPASLILLGSGLFAAAYGRRRQLRSR